MVPIFYELRVGIAYKKLLEFGLNCFDTTRTCCTVGYESNPCCNHSSISFHQERKPLTSCRECEASRRLGVEH